MYLNVRNKIEVNKPALQYSIGHIFGK